MTPRSDTTTGDKHSAGAFDIRNIIGALLGIYGVILLAMGIFGDTSPDKTGGVNANLYAGIALLGVGVAFLVWAWVRPTAIPDHIEKDRDPPPRDTQ